MDSIQDTQPPNANALTAESILRQARYALGQERADLSSREIFMALALSLRERIVDRMLETRKRHEAGDAKTLCYLSMEYLPGRSLRNNLVNLGCYEEAEAAVSALGADLRSIARTENDAALGNGGLGRLASCFLDSLATLDMPALGYGINYEFGLFRQAIRDGGQVELPDPWIAFPSPWLIERPDEACAVPLYGHVEHTVKDDGSYCPKWVGWRLLKGVPYDFPIVGYGGRCVNVLRLFAARASNEFDMQIFNEGDFFKAVAEKMSSETITKVLYPSDVFEAGRELRLVQEYFLVSCAVSDMMRRFLRHHDDLSLLPEKAAIQLNDTHPALAVAELMRVLVDEHHLPWAPAWEATRQTIGYTNHTLMPEALEKWPVEMMERVLPRHLEIIYEINRQFLEEVSRRWPGDWERLRRTSLIEEENEKLVRMAHLAVVGSHAVNGVARIHTELVRSRLFPDFVRLWPERFGNRTNGVSVRRWLLQSNPGLARLITARIGEGWITDFERIRELESLAEDPAFQAEFLAVKHANKERLAAKIQRVAEVEVSADALFDVQVKRIHEYKRQLLNVMHIIYEYLKLVEDGEPPRIPRVYIFAGKAAPGYWVAKQIIKLIHSVAARINADPCAREWIRVAFLRDYRVSLAEHIIPAADLSEQISTAGTEASGTSNMKLAMNGALTIGTLDGANIEIREKVGEENFYLFGLTLEEIEEHNRRGTYDAGTMCRENAAARRVMDALTSDRFCPEAPGLFGWVNNVIFRGRDRFFHLADLPSYLEAHRQAETDFANASAWARKAILNVARMGFFSSDRTIRQYAEKTWGLRSVS